MILRALSNYASTLPELPDMYTPTHVDWLIQLTFNGDMTDMLVFDKVIATPTCVRSSAIRPKLFVDNAEYVLGIAKRPSLKTRDRYQAFKHLIDLCWEATHEPIVKAVRDFLRKKSEYQLRLGGEVQPHHTVGFEVEGIQPITHAAVREFWSSYTQDDSLPFMTCLVTGETSRVERRLPGKVKGIPGGLSSGTSVVSVNASAFTSYGLENALNAPISRLAAERYTFALNTLLHDPEHSVRIGDVVVTHWGEGSLLPFLVSPTFEALEKVSDGSYHHLLVLSASGGRLVVRDYFETKLVKANLERFCHHWQASRMGFVSLVELCSNTLRQPTKQGDLMMYLLRYALFGEGLPWSCLVTFNVLQIPYVARQPSTSLIQLMLLSNGVMMMSDPTFSNISVEDKQAYDTGRLFAHLEAIQRAAIPDLNRSIVDYYFGMVQNYPRQILPGLMRKTQLHLIKLRRMRPGLERLLSKTLEDFLELQRDAVGNPSFLSSLNVAQRGLFTLGFYHQKAQMRSDIEARRKKST